MNSFLTGGIAAAFLATSSFVAFAAEPIEGVWKRPSSNLMVRYSGSGGKFCGTVVDGKFEGQGIGCMTGSNGTYAGKIDILARGKTYDGKAIVHGDVMKLEVCLASFCEGEDWHRQPAGTK